MRQYNIYLSGGMQKFGKIDFNKGNNWRKILKHLFENICCDYKVRVFNPNDYFNFSDEPKKYETEREVMQFDISRLRNSDLVICNFNDPSSLGTMAELAIAYERGIPVIGLCENEIRIEDLHPWQIEFCQRIFTDIDELFCYVVDLYLG